SARITSASPQNADDRLLSLLGEDGQLDLAFFDIENSVGRITLDKDAVVGAVLGSRSSPVGLGQKDGHIERRFGISFRFHALSRTLYFQKLPQVNLRVGVGH